MPDPTLRVNEVFYSIQGESTWAGRPCVFIRLTGCHLRCGYCDTEYAFYEGRRRALDELIAEAEGLGGGVGDGSGGELSGGLAGGRLVELTGGEPLLQPNVHPLIRRLVDGGWTVLVETSGACDISACDPRAIRIMDLKTPGSGESHRNDWANLDRLTGRDEVKFVLTSREDYEWSRRVIRETGLPRRVNAVLLSAVEHVPPGEVLPGVEGLALRDLANWILEDRLEARVQTQLHKIIWDPAMRAI